MYSKTKIAIISPQGYTGIAYYVLSLCKALTVVTADLNFYLITSEKQITNLPCTGLEIKPYFVNTYGDANKLIKGFNYIKAMVRSVAYILRSNIKIVHFQITEYLPVDVFFLLFLKMCCRKIVYTPHDITPFKPTLPFFIRAMYNLSDRIIVHNTHNKDVCSNDYGINKNKISVISPGNYEYFTNWDTSSLKAKELLKLPMDKKIILFFGSIRKGKGLEILVRALLDFPINIPSCLLIAGKADKNYSLDSIPFKIPGKSNTDFEFITRIGFISDSDTNLYLSAADVVVIPYEEISDSAVLRYAFTYGKPVVVSDHPAFSEIVNNRHNCLIFPRGNAEVLSSSLSEILSNPQLSLELSKESHRFASERWNWLESAKKTSDIYIELFS